MDNVRRKRVLVIDDSVFARKIVSDILRMSPQIEVVGAAINGLDGLKQAKELKPDVITLDVEMPELDGIETLKRLMVECPTPVVMVSSLTITGASISIQALNIGAVDIVAKPHGSHSLGLTVQRDELISKVLAAAGVDVRRLSQPIPVINQSQTPRRIIHSSAFPVVLIASSTGGPRALRTVIPQIDASLNAAYVVVQHLPEGFSASLAQDLDKRTEFDVREAEEGDTLTPGSLILAKAGYHCIIGKGASVRITRDPPLWGVRPSADITMASAVDVFGPRLIGVILTGMGKDGANGLKLIKEAGGQTIAEHESSCVVYGMPRAAIEMGVVDVIAPIERISKAINDAVASKLRA